MWAELALQFQLLWKLSLQIRELLAEILFHFFLRIVQHNNNNHTCSLLTFEDLETILQILKLDPLNIELILSSLELFD